MTERPKLVDLSKDKDGDRIAVVCDGTVDYLPATRVDIGATHKGASGSARYTRRAKNGDIYVTGPGLDHRMFRSSDNGRTWSSCRYTLDTSRFEPLRQSERDQGVWLGGFAILQDDTFLMNLMPSNHLRNAVSFMARSTDYGAAWTVERLEVPLGRHLSCAAGNNDMIQLANGTLLLTMGMWFYLENADEEKLPIEQQGVSDYCLRSTDGGRTWPEKYIDTRHGSEVHLLELPSGKILAAIRKQRNVRLPGDPTDIEMVMRANGYNPEYTGYSEPIDEGTAFFKHVALSESSDGGCTWVNERRVTGYEQCSGELTLLADGQTLVLQYDYRYHDRFAHSGVRARVSYDLGETWEPEEYILGEGENYPGGIGTQDGGLITICPNHDPREEKGPIQAVHWWPRGHEGCFAR